MKPTLYYIIQSDTDGNTEIYGSYGSQPQARYNMKEIIKKIDLDAAADYYEETEDSFMFRADNYSFYLKIEAHDHIIAKKQN